MRWYSLKIMRRYQKNKKGRGDKSEAKKNGFYGYGKWNDNFIFSM